MLQVIEQGKEIKYRARFKYTITLKNNNVNDENLC